MYCWLVIIPWLETLPRTVLVLHCYCKPYGNMWQKLLVDVGKKLFINPCHRHCVNHITPLPCNLLIRAGIDSKLFLYIFSEALIPFMYCTESEVSVNHEVHYIPLMLGLFALVWDTKICQPLIQDFLSHIPNIFKKQLLVIKGALEISLKIIV